MWKCITTDRHYRQKTFRVYIPPSDQEGSEDVHEHGNDLKVVVLFPVDAQLLKTMVGYGWL